MIALLLSTLLLDPPTPVSPSPRLLTSWVAPGAIRVIPSGNDFLVAWNLGSNLAHVNSEGEVLDHPSLRVATPENVRFFDLIRHGDTPLLGWYYFTDPGLVHIRAGDIDRPLPWGDLNSDTFRVVSNGHDVAALYRLKSAEYQPMTFLESGRTVSVPTSNVQTSFLTTGAVASDGSNFLVAGGSTAALLSGSGDVLATSALPFTPRDVIFADGDYVIVGSSFTRIEMGRVSRSGVPTMRTVVDNARGSISGLTIGSNASNFLVAWKEIYPGALPSLSSSVSLQARSVSAGGVVQAKSIDLPINEMVGRFAAEPDAPAVASNGVAYLLVWTEGTSVNNLPTRNLFSILLRPGETLSLADVDRRKRPVPSEFARQESPAVTRDGLVWSETFSEDNTGSRRQQIVANNVIVAPSSAAQQNPSAAWDGKRTWIAWNNSTGGIEATSIGQISAAGVAPRIACGDDACLVVWAENRSKDPNMHELFAARIVHGDLLDSGGFLIGTGKSYVGVGDYDVATDGSRFEVVWADRGFTGGAILHSTTFGPLTEGIATRNGDLAATTTSYLLPKIVWDGREYVILWIEQTILRGSRVNSDGNSLDGDATGWAGVNVGSATSLNALANIGGSLYAARVGSVLRIDPATLTVVDEVPIDQPLAFTSSAVVESIDGRLFLRAIAPERRRAVGE